MATIAAEEMAKKAGVNPQTLRQALPEASFPWHAHYDRWTVEIGSAQHEAMQRVLRGLSD